MVHIVTTTQSFCKHTTQRRSFEDLTFPTSLLYYSCVQFGGEEFEFNLCVPPEKLSGGIAYGSKKQVANLIDCS
eukprot:3974926-Amphidinium_carterae.1